eukprot:TRINITY_DN70556_c0_g1_i2.p2 TRINITY_DN70556_c0_g1~~TRINITY_DN70556_c0_g1_i2.p2  ORF type:complete len:107 (+),score=44.35 TRINITY_DN70556_c0_g1_i2:87-407(+)
MCCGMVFFFFFFFFQAEDGIRDVERSRGLGDVYKRQQRRVHGALPSWEAESPVGQFEQLIQALEETHKKANTKLTAYINEAQAAVPEPPPKKVKSEQDLFLSLIHI